jgi:aspartyl/asparaginyl beta-hydroxylase
MLTLPDHPLLDKIALIGGCARLPLQCDAGRLRAEIASMPASFWGTRGGRVGVHNPAQAVFLRGHAPAEGDLPVEDREALAHLPYARELITQLIPARPLRCLLALLPGGAVILPHIDRADYFSKTIRIHFPVTTHARVWMYCGERSYHMAAGEIWALNNSTTHGVWNADPDTSRLHMICDFLPTPALLDLLARADRDLGVVDAPVHERLFGVQPAREALNKSA